MFFVFYKEGLRLRFFGGVDRKNEEVREKILIKGIKKLGEE